MFYSISAPPASDCDTFTVSNLLYSFSSTKHRKEIVMLYVRTPCKYKSKSWQVSLQKSLKASFVWMNIAVYKCAAV